MSTIPTNEELVAFFDQGMFASEMARRFGLNNKSDILAVQSRCADLHNSGFFDLFQIVESGAVRGLDENDFYMARYFFCQILPELDATPKRMMNCVDTLVTLESEEMADNQPNVAFRIWCTKDSRRAQEIISAAHQKDEIAIRYLTVALESSHDFHESRQIAIMYDDVRRINAINALGRMADNDPASRSATFNVFSTLVESGSDDKLRATILNASAAILSRSTDVDSLDQIGFFQRIVKDAGELTIHQAAHVLWAFRKNIHFDVVACLLLALEKLNPENKRTVNELDHGLIALLENGYDEAAISYITRQLSSSDGRLQLKDFVSFSRALISGPPERLSRVVVKWLKIGDPILCKGLADALVHSNIKNMAIELNAEDLSISSEAQVFISRKAIGWFFFIPTTAASVLVSVLRVCNDDTAHEVQKLLEEQLLLNYSGVRAYLQNLTINDAAKCRVDQVLAKNDSYLEAIRSVPLIKELQPSEHYRRIEWLRISDEMNEAHKKAQSQSVLFNMVKTSVLLYGNRSLSFKKCMNETFKPVEMDLKPYRISFETPRMKVVDPVSLDYILNVFRMERMVS